MWVCGGAGGFSEARSLGKKCVLLLRAMAVGGLHADYSASAVEWARARDVLAGEDDVKAEGPKYLPRLAGLACVGRFVARSRRKSQEVAYGRSESPKTEKCVLAR